MSNSISGLRIFFFGYFSQPTVGFAMKGISIQYINESA